MWPRIQLASPECRQKYGLCAPSAFLLLWYALTWICPHRSDRLHYILEPGRSSIETLHVEDKPGLNSIFQITSHTPEEGGPFTLKEKSHGSPCVQHTLHLGFWVPSSLNEFSALEHRTEKKKKEKKSSWYHVPKARLFNSSSTTLCFIFSFLQTEQRMTCGDRPDQSESGPALLHIRGGKCPLRTWKPGHFLILIICFWGSTLLKTKVRGSIVKILSCSHWWYD